MRPDDRVAHVASLCSSMSATTVDNTFGEQSDVYRVGGKIFALVNTAGDHIVTFKADPAEAQALQASHDHFRPGYYMNKRHWVTADLSAKVDLDDLDELLQESHRLVLASLPRSQRPN